MLVGAAGPVAADRSRLLPGREGDAGSKGTAMWIGGDGAAAAVCPWSVRTLDADARHATDPASDSWLVFSGHFFSGHMSPATLLSRLTDRGLACLADVDGSFAFAWFDGARRRLSLVRDRVGAEPLFYAETGAGVLFASRIRDLRATGLLPTGICAQGLAEFLTFCYVPSDVTLDRDVHQVPAGGAVVVGPDGRIIEQSRWRTLSFAGPYLTDERAIVEQFRSMLEATVVRRIGTHRPGVFLSGGMDSSSILTFLRRHESGPIHSYSYRCASASFDESVYARAMAEAAGAEHTEVLFGADDALEIEQVVSAMDVPFCDLGLEVATWCLARAAGGNVDFVLTGTGGDEVWASHPVYAAQRVVGTYEKLPVPRFVNHALRKFAGSLPDSDRKRDLRVILKRLLPPEAFPRELKHYRWKAYYAPDDLRSVLTPEMASAVAHEDPFAFVRAGFEGYDGPDDEVTPCIYNDYTTMVPGFANRARLLRSFGVELRSPFLDRDLIDLGARIPARLKLEGVERTKRLFRVAMQGVLPDVINNRKDKLGLSIPLKNWLRDDSRIASRLAEACSPAALEQTGIFRPEAVARLLQEHRERRSNNSQRLWAILVLQLWLGGRASRNG
ncbi:MAG: asparagine synthase-related protein [Gemmatimonadales bacterium]